MKGVVLPWPSPVLSPNSRRHWTVKAKAAAKARRDATIACQAAGIRALPWQAMHVAIEFCPPDNRRRDTDNLLASLKSALDGIADASGVDDSRWTYTIAKGAKVKGGAVVVTVAETTWQHVGNLAQDIAKAAVLCQKQSGPRGATNANPALTITDLVTGGQDGC